MQNDFKRIEINAPNSLPFMNSSTFKTNPQQLQLTENYKTIFKTVATHSLLISRFRIKSQKVPNTITAVQTKIFRGEIELGGKFAKQQSNLKGRRMLIKQIS